MTCKFTYKDKLYVVEFYQDGEIWSEEEYWGTIIMNLTDKTFLDCPYYIDDEKEIIEIIEKHNLSDDWSSIDDYLISFNLENIKYYIDES